MEFIMFVILSISILAIILTLILKLGLIGKRFIFLLLPLVLVAFSDVGLGEKFSAMVAPVNGLFCGFVIALPHVFAAIFFGLFHAVVCYFIMQWKIWKQKLFGCEKDIPSSTFKTPFNCSKNIDDSFLQSSVCPAKPIDTDQSERLRTFRFNYDWQFPASELASEGFTFHGDHVQCYGCSRQFRERNLPRSRDDRHEQFCPCAQQLHENYQCFWDNSASRHIAPPELARGATVMSSSPDASVEWAQGATVISSPTDLSLELAQGATGVSSPTDVSLELAQGATGVSSPTDLSLELAQGTTGVSSPTDLSLELAQGATGVSSPTDLSLELAQGATGVSSPTDVSLELAQSATDVSLPTDTPDDKDMALVDVDLSKDQDEGESEK